MLEIKSAEMFVVIIKQIQISLDKLFTKPMTDRDPEEAMRVAIELFPATLELLRRVTFYCQYVP